MKKILLQIALLGAVIAGNAQTYQWANKFGDASEQIGTRVYLDQTSGKSFTSGHFKGTVDFDPGTGTTALTSGTGYNAYIASYTTTGALIWAKSFYSASGESYISGVVTDASLNVYISGYYKSEMDVDPGSATTSIATGGQQFDGFIVKLNAAGDLVWYKTIGSAFDERIRDIVLDGNNNIIVVGHSNATTLDIDPGTGTTNLTGLGASSGLSGPNTFGFVLKLNSAGNYVSNYQRADNNHSSRLTEYFFTRVKVNSANDIFVTGYHHYDDVFSGGIDNYNKAILIELSAANNSILKDVGFIATQNNSSAPLYTNIISDIEIDAANNYYLAGYFNYNIRIGNTTLTSSNVNLNKGWVAKYNSAGVAQWAKGIYQENTPSSIDLDNTGNVYIGGAYKGTVDFNPGTGVSNSTSFGGKDGYLFKLDNSGNFTGNVQKIGGQDDEVINDIVLNKTSGDIFITGAIQSTNVDFNPSTGNNTLSSSGLYDAFLAKYTPCSMPVPPVNTTLVGDLSICGGASTTLSVADQSGSTFSWFATATAGLQTSAGLTKTVTPSSTTSYFVQASNSCGTSTRTEIIVTVAGSAVTPTISASTTSPSTVCSGTALSFTSSQTNGGTPTYQWQLNGTPVSGQTAATYSTITMPVGTNTITCVMNSNAACRTVTTVTSNPIVVTVNSSTTPLVSVTTPTTTICAGTNASFVANATGGGASPLYQWKLNGTNQGGNTSTSTFSSGTLLNNSSVTCVVTSNGTCLTSPTATSNAVVMTVSPIQNPTASITSSITSTCPGLPVTFTATPTNAGTSPTYQWKLNGSNIGGATSSTYTSSSLVNGSSITCEVTSNATCAGPTITSNAIVISIGSVAPTNSIAASQTTICPGTTINFSATPTFGGTTPTYQWQLNGNNIGGATSSTYSSNALTNGSVITCVMTSSNACASPTTATSNSLTINVTGVVNPSIVVSAMQSTICQGDSLKLTAVGTNGGLNPSYQWKVNGANIPGATSLTYNTTSALNGEVYSCVITSLDPCASPSSVSSNSITAVVNALTSSGVLISTPSNPTCSGTVISFTATPTNGGTSPVYQWKINGNNVGTNSTTYTATEIGTGDVVTCVISPDVACPFDATSNGIIMTINNTSIPSASIHTTQTTICDSDTLHLNALAANFGELAPTYQWALNGNPIGTNDSISLSNLTNGDVISCVLSAIGNCVSPSSLTVNYTASVLSTAGNTNVVNATSSSICQGTQVTFNSVVSGTANSTSYQWFINGSAINGATTSEYSTFSLANNDAFYCIVTSVSACGAIIEDTSNFVTMTVGNPGQSASIYINTDNTSICSTDTIVFNANAYNVGNNPTYTWLVNGLPAGTDSTSFVTGSLTSGDEVECMITSSDVCLTNQTSVSDSIIIGVTQTVVPQLSMTVSDSVICVGENVNFNLSYSGGGTAPTIAWYQVNNSQNFLTSGVTNYNNASLNNNDTIVAVLINNDYCAIPNFRLQQVTISVGADTSVTSLNGTYTANLAGASYQWIDCNNANQVIVGETNQSFTPSVNGSFAVIVDPGSCPDTSSCYTLNNIGLTNNKAKSSAISIYPNPNSGDFTIEVNKTSIYNVINLLGETISSFELKSGIKNQIRLETLSNGVYYLIGLNVNEKIVITK